MPRFASIHDPERRKAPRFPVKLDIAIVFAEGPVRCQTVDVSLYGAYIETEHLLELDRAVRVRLQQGLDDPIEWMGLVRRVVTPQRATADTPAGVGLEIFSIGEPSWERWTWLIATVADRCEARLGPRQQRDSGPSVAVSPRRHVRFATPVRVRLASMPELVRFAARDISAGGIFLRPAPSVALGDEVALELRHPLSGDRFELEGRVVRVEPDGVAIEFINLTQAVRTKLKRFIVTGKRPG